MLNRSFILMCLIFGLGLGCGESSSSSTPQPVVDAATISDLGNADGGLEPDAATMPDAMVELDAVVCGCPGNQVCDGSGGCLEPEMCEAHEDCLSTRVCKEGVCSDGCRDDANCDGALSCDLDTQSCVEVSPCTSDANCFEGRLCLDGSCADRCNVDEDCGGAQTCIIETGRCMAPETCTDADDCPGAQICQRGECINECDESMNTVVCPGRQTCVEGACTEPAECQRDLDCRGERVCVNEACENPCMMDGCERALVCAVDTGRCQEAEVCTSDDACFEGNRCEGGECTSPCTGGADCSGNQRCEEGKCVEFGDCSSNLDCLSGRICQSFDGVSGTCVESCLTSGCSGELSCNEQTGACSEVDPCRRDDQCSTGRYCLEGACTPTCAERTDCDGALICNDGRCEESGTCFDDNQCLSGRICGEDLQCTYSCTADLPCFGTQVCSDTGECIEGGTCTENSDCLGSRVCPQELGVCVDACTPGSCIGNQVCGDGGFCVERDGCTQDGSCLGDRVCRLGGCRTVGCESNADCGADTHCVDWTCVDAVPNRCQCEDGTACFGDVCVRAAPCSNGNPCVAGSTCLPDGTCSECIEDADCPNATRCEDGACSEVNPCFGDAACLAGRVCENGSCITDTSCIDDIFASHGFPSAAVPLTNQVYTGLRVCIEEDDWFRFSTSQMAQIIVRHEASGVPLSLSVFSVLDEASPLDISHGTESEAWVSVTKPGEYLIRIHRPRGAPNLYDLQIRESDCVADGFEKPWNNDLPSQASIVSAQRVLGSVCTNETDWFIFEGSANANINSVSGATFRDENEALITTVSSGTRFRVEADGAYEFALETIREPGLRCEGAEVLMSGASQALRFYGDDFADTCLSAAAPEAVYQITTQSEGQLEVLYEGDALMTSYGVYDDCGIEPLFCANGLGGNITNSLDPGTYYIVLQGPSTGSVTVNHIEPLGCDDIPSVDLNTPTAVTLGAGLDSFAGGCFFNGPNGLAQFTLQETSRVQLSLTGTTSMPAQTGIALRTVCNDAASELICGGASTDLTIDVLEAGNYTVLVQGSGDATLTVAAQPLANYTFADECAGSPASLQTGDAFVLSGDFGTTDSWSAAACPDSTSPNGNDQFFNFSLAETATVSAALNVSGTIAILRNNCNQTFACGLVSNPVLGDLPVLSKQLAPGDYTLVVDGAGDGFEVDVSVQ